MNRKMNKSIYIVILLMIIVCFYGCKKEIAEWEIDFPSEIFVGDTGIIQVDSKILNDTFNFSSSDEEILLVNEFGHISTLKEGNVFINIVNKFGKVKVVEITIKAKPLIENIKLNINESGPFYVGETYSINYELTPNNSDEDIRFIWVPNNVKFDEETRTFQFEKAGKFTLICRSRQNYKIQDSITFDVDFSNDYETYHLLFIGNSLTKYIYDIPAMISEMILADGVTVHYTTDSPTAQWIIDHKNSFLNFINQNKYTHVILQEQSSGPINDYQKFESAVIEFNEKIKQNKAKTILYQTWGYNYEVPEAGDLMTKNLEIAYNKVAQKIDATISPVGNAFYYVNHNFSDIPLYYDLNHPSLYGAYLSACVHYAILTGRNAADNNFIPDELNVNIREILQNAADYVVFGLNE